MCGICGFVGQFGKEKLENMTDVISHRGPDDKGYYLDESCGLGHRRLSIIDLNTGSQPIYNEDKSLVIIYNGEVYNFQYLREQLLSKGHIFKSKTDTEVIIHLYEEYGYECVHHLRGMFAFAIWNKRSKELFLVRDRFGIKPVYYTELSGGSFIFASEIKSILEIPEIKREIDLVSFDEYFTFRYVPGTRTMFKNIYKLEPGHFLIRRKGQSIIKQYWDIDFDKKEPYSDSVDDISDRLTCSLREAVGLRLISEVPLGAYLSGGLDSSFMVGLMSEIKTDPVETFSIGFDDTKWNESYYSDIVAKHYKTNHHRLIAKANAIDLIKKVIWHLDEPLADAATIPTFMMSELTREFVTVVLSGEGTDELLGGYDKYKVLGLGHALRFFTPGFIFKGFASCAGKNIKLSRLCEFLAALRDPAQAYLQLVAVFSEKEKQELYRQPSLMKNSSYELIRSLSSRFKDTLHNYLYIDIKTWLPNDVLLKNDKMSMANSIEARVPFLDHLFAEDAARVPASLKMRGMTEKYILRKAMEPIVPRVITRRRKHGFTVPLQHWMEGELDLFSRSVLSRNNIEKRGLLNYEFVDNLRCKSMNNVYYRRQFWGVLTFELWCQTFLD